MRNILEEPTKWNFHDSPRIDSPRIDSPRIEQSLLEKTSTSLVYLISYEYVDTALKHVTSTCIGPNGPRLIPKLPLGYGPVTPSRRVPTPPCESSVAGPARSRASTGVQRSPAERRPVQRIKFFQFARKSSRAFENFFCLFHPVSSCKVRPQGAGCAASPTSPTPPKRHRATS
jgi:hypothetical protein